jgi:hypothetical protein
VTGSVTVMRPAKSRPGPTRQPTQPVSTRTTGSAPPARACNAADEKPHARHARAQRPGVDYPQRRSLALLFVAAPATRSALPLRLAADSEQKWAAHLIPPRT